MTNITTNGTAGDWVALLPHELTDFEKRLLQAIVTVGAYIPVSTTAGNEANGADDPEEGVLALLPEGYVTCKREGETFTSNGRSRNDAVEVYRATELGKLWLQSCRPISPGTEEAAV